MVISKTIGKRLAALAVGFSAAIVTITPASSAEVTARFAVDGFVLGTLIRVAEAKGYFEEENVDATLLTFSYGVDTVDAVLAGQADFGVIIDMPMLSRFTSGKLASPAVIGMPKPGWHKLYVKNDYASPSDLKGKKIAVATGTAQEFVTRVHLQDNGVDPDSDVDFVGLASLFEIVGAMKANRVDAAWIWGQGVEQMADSKDFRFEVDDSVVNQSTVALLVVSKDYLAGNRDTVLATLRALAKAGAVVKNDLDEAARIVAEGVAGDAGKIKPVIEGQRYALSFEESAMASLKAKYDFLVDQGVIDQPYDFADQFDLEVLREAVPDANIVESLN